MNNLSFFQIGYLSHVHRPNTKLYLVHCIEYPSMPSRDTWETQTRAGRRKAEELAKKYQEKLQKYNVRPRKKLQSTKLFLIVVKIN